MLRREGKEKNQKRDFKMYIDIYIYKKTKTKNIKKNTHKFCDYLV